MRVPAAPAVLALALALAACARRPPWVAPELAWAYPPAAPEAPSAAGRVPTACTACHGADGLGAAGAPDLAGLPAAYIVEQVQAFRAGRRVSSQAGRPATARMILAARAVSDPELARAAARFAALPRRPWVQVTESGRAPAVRPDADGGWRPVPGGEMRPTGRRIVEVRTARIGPDIAAYVPPGSRARGEALARSGGHGGEACASCHSADLRGLGDTPPLAGRSPSYLARALWDFKTGARRGPETAPMQGPAGALDAADITDVAAYLASLRP